MNLNTVVKNTSGARRYFGYLGRHGATLDAGATFEHPGTLAEFGPQKRKALEYDLAQGHLEIVRSPAYLAYDATAQETQAVGINNAQLQLTDPWFAPGSSA